MHGRDDHACPAADAQAAFDAAEQPKEIFWTDAGNHIDLYDDDTYVTPAIERTVTFFDFHLGRAAS